MIQITVICLQYVHTKGAFWPGNVFINQERLNVPANVSLQVKFQPFINEKLDDNKCINVSVSSYFYKTRLKVVGFVIISS